MEDRDLDRLLREWKAPDAPSHLRAPRAQRSPQRWLVAQRSRWRWLVSGSFRVPVPVAAAALLLVGLWVVTTRTAPLTTPDTSTSTPRRSGEVARYRLTGPLAGYDAVIVEFNFGPGVAIPAHRHPGPIAGYVVDGQMRFGVNNEPEQAVPPGGTFFEPQGALHSAFGSANRDAPTRVIGFMVVPTGSRLSGPA
jgi:quercetin dioxygenase-like cupin family protein